MPAIFPFFAQQPRGGEHLKAIFQKHHFHVYIPTGNIRCITYRCRSTKITVSVGIFAKSADSTVCIDGQQGKAKTLARLPSQQRLERTTQTC
ncbi:hypothetical protein ACLD9W_11830 [Neisseria sp. WLZKY-1]|uniref:hypothetical protein n=1 Tax=Neisseria sp. WLZKY-1 TaxID=3390377 RepID=UPI0039788D5D